MTEIPIDRSGEIIEKFELKSLIGEGGMGQVYLAQHSLTDRKVALKILHESFAHNDEILERIRREAKAAALIGHPNIVEIIDSGSDQYGAPYIAMELLNGESLDDFIIRKGPLPVPLATYIISDMLDTLAAAHDKGVVHRDLKPENVFLNKRHKSNVPQIKILDFGISKFLTMDNQDMSLTKTGTVMGTPYYMSVEQAMGQKVDGRSDIYSVAVMLYQLLTARLPFYDTNYNRVLIQIVSGDYVPVSELRDDIPPELSQIIDRGMQKDRDARYPDCLAFKAELDPFWTLFDPEELFSEDSFNSEIHVNQNIPLVSNPDINKLSVPPKTSSVPSIQSDMVTMAPGELIPSEKSRKKAVFGIFAVLAIILTAVTFFFLKGNSSDEEIDDNQNVAVSSMKVDKPVMKIESKVNKTDNMKPDMKVDKKSDMKVVKPAHPETVRITIQKLPDRALVYYDGKKIKHPLTVKYDQHEHLIIVKARHRKDWVKKVKPVGNISFTYSARRKSSSSHRRMSSSIIKRVNIMKTPMKIIMKTPMKTPMKIKSADTPDF